MSSNIRAALERLVSAYDNNEGLPIAEWIAAARAALAEPVGEGPSDQEIADVFSQGCRDPSRPYEPPFLGGARAVLAKWGHPAAPPAPEPGEVGELIQCLQIRAASLGAQGANLSQRGDAAYFTRAATLLQQQAAPAPVVVPAPVAERLPGEGDLDVEGKCWWWTRLEDGRAVWILKPQLLVPALAAVAIPRRTHWLPAHAIPLPQAGEGEA